MFIGRLANLAGTPNHGYAAAGTGSKKSNGKGWAVHGREDKTMREFEDLKMWRFENAVDYIGRFDTGHSIPCPFYISFGFKLEEREKSERVADKYRMLKTKQGDSKLPMFFPKMIEEIDDWRYVSNRISSGERLGQAVMYIVLSCFL